jgi:hypothetical protein
MHQLKISAAKQFQRVGAEVANPIVLAPDANGGKFEIVEPLHCVAHIHETLVADWGISPRRSTEPTLLSGE